MSALLSHRMRVAASAAPQCPVRAELETGVILIRSGTAINPAAGRLKDRNRQAQRRYRQKRREKMQTAAERVTELEALVKSLSTDKVGIVHFRACRRMLPSLRG